MKDKYVVVQSARGGWAIYPCLMPCDDCPFKFECYTKREQLVLPWHRYYDVCQPYTGGRNIRLIALGTRVDEDLPSLRHYEETD